MGGVHGGRNFLDGLFVALSPLSNAADSKVRRFTQMTHEELIKHIQRLIDRARYASEITGHYAQICEFLRTYAGPKNSFLDQIQKYDPRANNEQYASENIARVLRSYLEYVQAGLSTGISPERKAQLDVVSDFLEMAHLLLETKGVHPAAPAVLVGASLEEFLRTWVETAGLSLGVRKPGLESYSQVLREAELITKQDGKDITSWAGIRNHAAHGEWQEVADKSRISLMLEGVNLFMRRYGA